MLLLINKSVRQTHIATFKSVHSRETVPEVNYKIFTREYLREQPENEFLKSNKLLTV